MVIAGTDLGLHLPSCRVSARLDERNRLEATVHDLHIGVHARVAATDLLDLISTVKHERPCV